MLGKTVFLLAFGFFTLMNGLLLVGGGLAVLPLLLTQANLGHFLACGVMAALWVYPSKQLRDAFPSWCEGVVILCFWSFFLSVSLFADAHAL